MKFSCARAPFLRLGDRVEFSAGVFETEDPELIAIVKANDWFGGKITENPNAKPTITAAPMRLGTVTTRNVIDRTTVNEANRYPRAEVAEPGDKMAERVAKAAATRARHKAERAALAEE